MITTILFLAVFACMTLMFHFVPNWTRPDIFFTVTVARGFRATDAGRAILKQYRTVIWMVGIPAAAIQPFVRTAFAWELLPVAGYLGALLMARRQTQAFAAVPDTTVEVDLAAPEETLPGGPWAVVLPLASLAALALWTARTPSPDYSIAAVHAGLCLMLVFMAWGILHWSRRVATEGPRAASERRFRRRCAWLVVVSAFLMSVQAWILQLRPPAAVTYAWAGSLTAAILIFLVLLIRSGQGGSHDVPESAGGPPVGDRTPDACWKWGIVYFNPADPAVFVEKRFGLGYTFNFGSRWAWAVLITLILSPIGIKLLLR